MIKLNCAVTLMATFIITIILGIAGCSAPQTVHPVQIVKTIEAVKQPPIISNVRISKATESAVWITWETDLPTNSELIYWEKGTEKRNTITDNDTISTIHFSSIQPIDKERVYDFVIKARDFNDPQIVSVYEDVFSIKTGPQITQYAPDFELPVLKGESMRLSQFHGKSVLLVFWDLTCSSCQIKMPFLQKKFKELDNNKFIILSVHISGQEGEINSYCVDRGITLPVLLDMDRKVSASYEVMGLPATFVIDHFGIIRAKDVEINTQEDLDKLIDQYITG
jgi:peroxiredoxin